MDTSKIKEMFNYSLDEKFAMQDLSERKLYINYEIDEKIIDLIVYHILRYNKEDLGKPINERVPIKLYCTSNGGSLTDGFELIDVILASKTPVYTINLGYQYSMGFLIGLAGHKRYGTKNATYLLHDGQNMVWNSSSKVMDQMKFQEKQESKIKDFVLQHSKITSDEYDIKYRVEWYLFNPEAKEKGFCDYIIGEDCELDEIL